MKTNEAESRVGRRWRVETAQFTIKSNDAVLDIINSSAAVLLSGVATEEQRQTAARALAERLSIKPMNPEARAVLMRRARMAGLRRPTDISEWARGELVSAIFRAVEDRNRPQPVRIGRKWVNGSTRPVVPTELPLRLGCRWLKIRAQRLFEESLAPHKPRRRLAITELEPQHGAVFEATGGCSDLTADEIAYLRLATKYELGALERSIRDKLRKKV